MSGPFSKKKSRRENSPSSFGMLLVAEAAEALISLFTKGNLHYAHFLLQTEVFDAVLESDHKFINRHFIQLLILQSRAVALVWSLPSFINRFKRRWVSKLKSNLQQGETFTAISNESCHQNLTRVIFRQSIYGSYSQ